MFKKSEIEPRMVSSAPDDFWSEWAKLLVEVQSAYLMFGQSKRFDNAHNHPDFEKLVRFLEGKKAMHCCVGADGCALLDTLALKIMLLRDQCMSKTCSKNDPELLLPMYQHLLVYLQSIFSLKYAEDLGCDSVTKLAYLETKLQVL